MERLLKIEKSITLLRERQLKAIDKTLDKYNKIYENLLNNK